MDGAESVPQKMKITNNNALETAHEDKEDMEDMEDMEDCALKSVSILLL